MPFLHEPSSAAALARTTYAVHTSPWAPRYLQEQHARFARALENSFLEAQQLSWSREVFLKYYNPPEVHHPCRIAILQGTVVYTADQTNQATTCGPAIPKCTYFCIFAQVFPCCNRKKYKLQTNTTRIFWRKWKVYTWNIPVMYNFVLIVQYSWNRRACLKQRSLPEAEKPTWIQRIRRIVLAPVILFSRTTDQANRVTTCGLAIPKRTNFCIFELLRCSQESSRNSGKLLRFSHEIRQIERPPVCFAHVFQTLTRKVIKLPKTEKRTLWKNIPI